MKSVDELMGNLLIKAVERYTLKEDFKEYFIKDEGAGLVTEANYETVKIQQGTFQQSDKQKEEGEEEDFYLEEEEETVSGIKACQFHASLIVPTSGQALKAIKSPPNINLQSCLVQAYGSNSDQKSTLVLLNNQVYCYGLGCAIVIEKVGQSPKIYFHHRNKVTSLCKIASRQGKIKIFSGTRGMRPELHVWEYSEESNELQLICKRQGNRKSNGIGKLQPISETLLCYSDAVQIHKDCYITVCDIQSLGKKMQKKIVMPKSGKVYDYTLMANKDIIIVTDKGVMKIEEPFDKVIKQSQHKQFLSICSVGSEYFCGDRQGFIESSTDEKKIKAHKGLVLLLEAIKSNEKKLIISSGSEDRMVCLFTTKLQKLHNFELSSYCTSKSLSIDESQCVFGNRDGSYWALDITSRKFVDHKFYDFSAVEEKKKLKMDFMTQKQVLAYPVSWNQVALMNMEQKMGKQKFITINLKSKTLCADLNGLKLFSISVMKQGAYPLYVRDISQPEGKQLMKKYKISLSEEQGVPSRLKYCHNIAIIGTDKGKILAFHVREQLGQKMAGKEQHMKQVEQIILEENPKKQNSLFFKTRSGSELFLWEADFSNKAAKLSKITKTKDIKDLEWRRQGKYSWELKKIWDKIQYFGDICDASLVRNQLLFVAMADGVLRIYRHPATPQNFSQFKLFNGEFRLAVSKNMLFCEQKNQILCFDLGPQ